MSKDPIIISAQAREMLQTLHKRGDVVVKFKTNKSGYAEDQLDAIDELAPGHFRADKKIMQINLDKVLGTKPIPSSLKSIEDWRKYPVLAGVCAHESAHARWSLWESDGNELPSSIPNPDYDPSGTAPEFFPVDPEDGKLYDLAKLLEEPRVERLGVKTFTKTWRKAMQFSATHLIMEQADEDEANEVSNLESAVRTMVLVGGRLSAGTLGVSFQSRQATKKVLEAAQKVIETELQERISEEPGFDPYYDLLGLITEAVFLNEHTDATAQLEIARKMLKIMYPENADNPDGDPGDGEGEEGDGGGAGSSSEALSSAVREAMDGLISTMQEETRVEEEQPESKAQESGGHGATIYNNPKAPQIDRYERPNTEDRALYHKALSWMEEQIQPTVSETEVGQWLPTGGARLDVRSHIRDNLAGHVASQRTDWSKPHEEVQPAPPVKVAIMLDGSGSMSSYRRPSASIAWAVANAAAQLPESRTVSVVYGAAAQVTQKPGHEPVRELAISNTDGPWENFGEAAELVEEALWLDQDNYVDPHDPEGSKQTNTLVVIVSDLIYGGSGEYKGVHRSQAEVFNEVTQDWVSRGYTVAVIGASEDHSYVKKLGINFDGLILADKPEDLFNG